MRYASTQRSTKSLDSEGWIPSIRYPAWRWAGPRLVTCVTAVAASLAAACSQPQPESPTQQCAPEPIIAYGFEQAKVGRNELPIGVFCDPERTQSVRVRRVEVRFVPEGQAEGEAIEADVEYRPGAHTVGEANSKLSFDYVVHAVFDRPGTWTMTFIIEVPWAVEPARAGRQVVVRATTDDPTG